MNDNIANLKPELVWSYFSRLCKIPRTSGNEKQVGLALLQIADELHLERKISEEGNVTITKPASPGFENRPTIMFQAHMDMVGVHSSDVKFDFLKDEINTVITEDGFVTADGTTLGVDDGMGVAISLAILADPNLKHPPLVALFTVGEETDMKGAHALKPQDVLGNICINIDSEDLGEICIGCAGGISTSIEYTPEITEVPKDFGSLLIQVSHGAGGHSGIDVDKGHINAATALLTLMSSLANDYIKVHLSSISSGTVRNAIPGDGSLEISMNASVLKKAKDSLEDISQRILEKYHEKDPSLNISVSEVPTKNIMISEEDTANVIALRNLNTGVLERTDDGQPLTSCNLGVLKMESGSVKAEILARFATEQGQKLLTTKIHDVVKESSSVITEEESYPAWVPDFNSNLAKIATSEYQKTMGKDAKITVIHAGLECGLLKGVNPELDVISIGPDIYGAHTTNERVRIKSVADCYEWIKCVINKIIA